MNTVKTNHYRTHCDAPKSSDIALLLLAFRRMFQIPDRHAERLVQFYRRVCIYGAVET